METVFKILFFLAILVFAVLNIGLFLLFIKVMFLFAPEVEFIGIKFTPIGL